MGCLCCDGIICECWMRLMVGLLSLGRIYRRRAGRSSRTGGRGCRYAEARSALGLRPLLLLRIALRGWRDTGICWRRLLANVQALNILRQLVLVWTRSLVRLSTWGGLRSTIYPIIALIRDRRPMWGGTCLLSRRPSPLLLLLTLLPKLRLLLTLLRRQSLRLQVIQCIWPRYSGCCVSRFDTAWKCVGSRSFRRRRRATRSFGRRYR